MLTLVGLLSGFAILLGILFSSDTLSARTWLLRVCVWASTILGGALSVARRLGSPAAGYLEVAGTATLLTCFLLQLLLAKSPRGRAIAIPLLSTSLALLGLAFTAGSLPVSQGRLAGLVALSFLPGIVLVIWLSGAASATLLDLARKASVTVSLGSLALAVVLPGFAFGNGYSDMRRIPIGDLGLRLSGLTPHPNFLGLVAAIAFGLTFGARSRAKPLVLLLLFSVVVLTESRIAILGLALGFVFHHIRRMRDSALRIFLAALCLGIVTILAPLAGSGDAGPLAVDADTDGRYRVWSIVWQEFCRYPLMGFGSFAFLPDKRSPFAGSGLLHAHNAFFQAAAETGILGVICVLLLLVVATRTLWRTAGERGEIIVGSIFLAGVFTEPLLSMHLYGFNFAILPCLLYLLVVRASITEALTTGGISQGLGQVEHPHTSGSRASLGLHPTATPK